MIKNVLYQICVSIISKVKTMFVIKDKHGNICNYEGKRLDIYIDGKHIDSYEGIVNIEINESFNGKIENASGNVNVSKFEAGSINTMSGDVIVDSSDNIMSIETMSGNVTVSSTKSVGKIGSMSGSIKIHEGK